MQEESDKNDVAAQKLISDSQACEKLKAEANEKLGAKKASFTEMKRAMSLIEQEEHKLKETIEEKARERNTCKEKCDRVK